MSKYFEDMNLVEFWDKSDYFTSDIPLTEEIISKTQELLGYKLPKSYIELLKTKNGGSPVNCCFLTNESTSWDEDHVCIQGICGIGGKWGIDSEDFGSIFMIEDWGYPNIGIVFGECPSAGHDAIMMDYRKCGKDGEPEIIHVDVESDDEAIITFLAKNFEEFIKGLVNEEIFDTSKEDYVADVERIKSGSFSPLLKLLCDEVHEIENIEQKIRNICLRILEEKKYFAFHADELSYLMYDIQFWLYIRVNVDVSEEKYLEEYKNMIAFGGEFGTGGYAPDFIKDYLNIRKKEKKIFIKNGKLRFAKDFEESLIALIQSKVH